MAVQLGRSPEPDVLPQYTQTAPLDLARQFATAADWQAVVTAAGDPNREFVSAGVLSQSRICFIRPATATTECSYFRDLFASHLTFQVLDALAIVPLTAGHPRQGLEMKASALYPTGTLHETAIWVYDRGADQFRVAIAVTSGEVRLFPTGALEGCLVTADWRWPLDSNETRFGSNHHRAITVYRFVVAGSSGTYRKVLSYVTPRKYSPEDTGTIEAELATIQARLQR